jgi:hypothetical protein
MSAWTARNPLGIIALFISLIYGMSALLLGTTVSSLSPSNQTNLVWFVIAFPVAVLAAFLWLVAKHHRKLYSPADYRSDEGFLAQPGTPELLGERLVEEVDAFSDELEAAGEDVPQAPESPVDGPSVEAASSPSVERRRAAVATAYLAEGLAFKELQEEFGSGVRQHVRVRSSSGRFIEIDGLIESSGTTYVVEVKLVRNSTDYFKRVRDAVAQIERIYREYDGISSGAKGMLVLVVAGEENNASVRARTAILTQSTNLPIAVRTYQLEHLLEKYGFEELKPL